MWLFRLRYLEIMTGGEPDSTLFLCLRRASP
jgi:hypothetical protein